MSDFFNAFEMSPVPAPAEDAQPPEPFHGIYGMPMFVTVSAQDLAQSVEFWTDGLGCDAQRRPAGYYPAGERCGRC